MDDGRRLAPLAERAQQVIPGGVNSPVRAFSAVGADPLFVTRGSGAHITDIDGNDYLDYIGSWGPLIFGHGHGPTTEAICRAARDGISFGLSSPREVEFAEALVDVVPALDSVRLVTSGTEACMSALRLARGYTQRERIVKIIGGYHGHADALLVRAGSGAETLGIPDSAGVPAGAAQDTLLLPYNDLDAAKELFAAMGSTIAAMIVEPVAGNMGTIAPVAGYLEGLRRLTDESGALLIFDEVMTGFRIALGGASEYYAVVPDLVTLGKIIGGGLPVGAYGGRAEIMAHIAPQGPVYQAGTLSGNPLAVAAGFAMLGALRNEDPYALLESYGARLESGLMDAARFAGIPFCVNRVGSMVTAFFTEGPVDNLESAQRSDLAHFSAFHRQMRNEGIIFPPSQFETVFICVAHSLDDIDRTVEAAKSAFLSL